MERILEGKKILLGVSGSIAAYKAPMLVRELIKEGAEVKAIMTPAAKEFVTPITLSSVSKNPVVFDMFDLNSQSNGAWHIHLAHWCDLAIIAPCSASTLSKLANGLADNALTAVFMALPKHIPLLIAPAMDTTMFEYPATQNNIKILKDFGFNIIPPDEGELASGLSGLGRLADISVIMDYIAKSLNSTDNHKKILNEDNILLNKSLETIEETIEKNEFNTELEFTLLKHKFQNEKLSKYFSNKKVLITAGPTIEQIDTVRYLSNSSSGKMGFAIAEAARQFGADVTLITGPVNLVCSSDINRIDVVSAEDMYNAVIENFENQDVVIMAAAVADFTPKNKFDKKIKKNEVEGNLNIEFIPTKDILLSVGKQKKANQILVGFALESQNEIEYGQKKLIEKNADLIVINSTLIPDSTFQSDFNQVTIINRKNERFDFGKMSKKEVAKIILEKVVDYTQN
ncbi:MAG: bifunctional phosphopantothenoylcysteine decarboxylase/phosphopantothenate synthase [Candidatus Kapaibacteriota bacterium]